MRILLVLLSFLVCVSISQAQTVIQMEKKGGVYYVPCTVNGLKLQFIFDTGASDVSISMSEAMFMLKNGYMSKDDLLGIEYYQIANGDVAEGTNIILRNIVIGDKELRNVKASIVHSATAPLLLGQSVLERFGNVSINYSNQTLMLGGSGSAVTPQPTSTGGASTTGSFVDARDGKRYKTVNIGGQVWMAENLDYKPPKGSYWAYMNDPKNVVTYGYLYDWETAKEVCPEGWHLPTDAEWTVLTDFLGGKEEAGRKMKSENGWSTKGNGTNESGFSGMPSGYRYSNGDFDYIGMFGRWWSSSAASGSSAWYRILAFNNGDASRYREDWSYGFSVRCVRD